MIRDEMNSGLAVFLGGKPILKLRRAPNLPGTCSKDPLASSYAFLEMIPFFTPWRIFEDYSTTSCELWAGIFRDSPRHE